LGNENRIKCADSSGFFRNTKQFFTKDQENASCGESLLPGAMIFIALAEKAL
jgi:hypothetical protein